MIKQRHAGLDIGIAMIVAAVSLAIFSALALPLLTHAQSTTVSYSNYSNTNTNWQQTYYPNAWPSSWYVLPGQTMSFGGSGFAPNAPVTISGPFGTVQATADGSGNFSIAPFAVPFTWQNSTQHFSVTSPGSAYGIDINLGVGTFYPQINPSAWWIGYGQGMNVSGSGFAPNEQVALTINGSQVAHMASDGSGNVNFNITTPGSGSTASIAATGLSSGVSTTQTIYLHS